MFDPLIFQSSDPSKQLDSTQEIDRSSISKVGRKKALRELNAIQKPWSALITNLNINNLLIDDTIII